MAFCHLYYKATISTFRMMSAVHPASSATLPGSIYSVSELRNSSVLPSYSEVSVPFTSSLKVDVWPTCGENGT